MKQDKNTIDRHHLLEIIYWPNEDGSFTKIINSADRLKELGIYDDWKMTILLTKCEHSTLHRNNMTDEHRNKISKANKGRKRKPFSEEHRNKMSITRKENDLSKGENNPMYGKKHSNETKKKMCESLKKVRESYMKDNLGLTWNEFQKHYKQYK